MIGPAARQLKPLEAKRLVERTMLALDRARGDASRARSSESIDMWSRRIARLERLCHKATVLWTPWRRDPWVC